MHCIPNGATSVIFGDEAKEFVAAKLAENQLSGAGQIEPVVETELLIVENESTASAGEHEPSTGVGENKLVVGARENVPMVSAGGEWVGNGE